MMLALSWLWIVVGILFIMAGDKASAMSAFSCSIGNQILHELRQRK